MPSPTRSSERHDVVVVGARCAGAATALLLARAGHDVVLVDRTTFPADTLSTHAIARSGVVQLRRWGLLEQVLASGAPPLRDIAFHDADGVVTRRLGRATGSTPWSPPGAPCSTRSSSRPPAPRAPTFGRASRSRASPGRGTAGSRASSPAVATAASSSPGA